MTQQYQTTSAGSHLNNRCIFKGPQSVTWPVPEGTTEVHVHVWGGGGGGCGTPTAFDRGGGGGGYARTSLAVTDSDSLSITVGGLSGTSSVSVPTQTPGSPISATGGSPGSSTDGGPGGSGSVTLAPTQCDWYCFVADGGMGGKPYAITVGAGGGAAGSPLGVGGTGGEACASTYGGGIGAAPGGTYRSYQTRCFPDPANCGIACINSGNGGTFLGGQVCNVCWYPVCFGILGGTISKIVHEFGAVGCSYFANNDPYGGSSSSSTPVFNRSLGDEWFYVEDMAGSASGNFTGGPFINFGSGCTLGDGGAGAGGSPFAPAGVLGGGGSGPFSAGCAGGQGSYNTGLNPGTPGMIVIYW